MTIVYIAAAVIGALILIIAILGMIAPKEGRYERNLNIEIQPKDAFQHLRSLKTFDTWSPWADRDLNQERGYKGEDGEIGSLAWWRGNKDVGEGEQQITKLQPDTYIEMELRFLKPFKAINTAYFKIKPAGSGSNVTWGLHAKYGFPMNIMMMMMNMDKRLGADFEKGLRQYKAIAEKKTA